MDFAFFLLKLDSKLQIPKEFSEESWVNFPPLLCCALFQTKPPNSVCAAAAPRGPAHRAPALTQPV